MLNRRVKTFIVHTTQTQHAKKVKTLMGKQSNKVEKRKRRTSYLKRKKAAAWAKKPAASKAS